MKKILLFGSKGQLGSQLAMLLNKNYNLIEITHADLDFNKFYMIEDLILKNVPDIEYLRCKRINANKGKVGNKLFWFFYKFYNPIIIY